MTNKLSVIIVEDEHLARTGLLAYIKEVAFLELLEVCEDALEANQALMKHKPDLVFLDIQMPKMTGIDFLKSLSRPPMVIFTTAYPNYALQGFELDVVDYLVKPYPFDRFLKAVNKAQELHLLKTNSASAQGLPAAKTHFFVKTDNKLERINMDEILYAEAMENYVSIVTVNGKTITLMSMKALEELLPAELFLRIHKTYIVAINKVQAIQGNEVLIGNKHIPFSRQKRNEVMDRLTGIG
jgi:DNA-binding LytR/AlgR family response regulator